MENNNKKTLILSIVGILVLVIAVVGVSFAMFTFTGNGTKENVIKTGTITVDFSSATKGNYFEISNKYPMSDATAATQQDNTVTFDVVGSWGTLPMTVNYDIGLSSISQGATLTNQYVKVTATKDGTPTTSNATVASLQNVAGTHNLIEHYALGSGVLLNESGQTTNLTDTWVIRAWVSDQYNLPDDADNSTAPEVTGGEVSNNSNQLHKKTSKSETYSFKVTAVAAQATA